MNSSADKSTVLKGIIGAWLVSAAFNGGLYFTTPGPTGLPPFTTWAAALSIPVLSLMIGIMAAARHRHFKSHIDGSAPEVGTQLDVILRYNQNTLEQVIIFAGAAGLASVLMPDIAMKLLPLMSLWFGLARLAFYIGYKRRAVLRAFGFAATFHPSVILFFAAFFSLFIRHF